MKGPTSQYGCGADDCTRLADIMGYLTRRRPRSTRSPRGRPGGNGGRAISLLSLPDEEDEDG